ncbi:MAG TPA: VWA domain-containing protein [Pyrinomonadaceae bacterium]|jgi:Ca-activated chloride channel family protein|nr:VWA domain-containing protein [Pyrinomonadaceae bacterium]
MKIVRFRTPFVILVCGLCAAATLAARTPRQQTGAPQPAQAQQTPAPRATPATQEEVEQPVTARVVRVPVTVLDKKGQPVTGLTRNDFQVLEDKRPVQFDFLGESVEIEKQPIYIGVLMDTSSSTAGKLGFEKEAAKNFLYTVTRTRKDQAAFVTFDDDVTLRQDFTKNLNLLERAIDNVKKPGTQTALFDAVWQFCDEKMRNAASTRRALVVITDGDDTYSRARLDDAIQIAQKTDTIVFAISTKGGFTGSAVPGVEAGTVKDAGDKELQKLSEETGGRAFFTGDMLALERAFKKVGEELRSQYLITYKPEGPFDGRYRRIEVKVATGGGYKVSAKRGYTADRDMMRK